MLIDPGPFRNEEEPFNHEFARILWASLKEGPEMVSAIHPDPQFSMGENTELVALQDFETEFDPVLEDGSRWEIDIAFEDDRTLFGIESKRGADFGDGQLEGELQVLEKNAGEKQPVLLAITEDRTTPTEVQKLDAVRWTSWYSVGKRIEEQFDNPLQYLVSTMIDTDKFEGFPDPADSQSMLEWQNQFIKLLEDVDRALDELHLASKITNYGSQRLSERRCLKDAYQPSPLNLFASFLAREDRSVDTFGRKPTLDVYGHFVEDELGVFLNLNAAHDPDGWVEPVLRGFGEEIINKAFDEEMILRCSYNSQCNPKHPPIHKTERVAAIDHIYESLGDGYGKRILIGRYLEKQNTPEATVESVINELRRHHKLFFDDDQILGQYR